MSEIIDFKVGNIALVKTIAKQLKKLGVVPISHCRALAVTVRVFGYKGWFEFNAEMRRGDVSVLDPLSDSDLQEDELTIRREVQASRLACYLSLESGAARSIIDAWQPSALGKQIKVTSGPDKPNPEGTNPPWLSGGNETNLCQQVVPVQYKRRRIRLTGSDATD